MGGVDGGSVGTKLPRAARPPSLAALLGGPCCQMKTIVLPAHLRSA